MHHPYTLIVRAVIGLALVQACDDSTPTGVPQDPDPARQIEAAVRLDHETLCDSETAGFSLASTNPYFPLTVGNRWKYRGEEDGDSIRLTIRILDKTEVVGGVTTHVLRERESINGELFEVSDNYYAEAADGTVCYFGEQVDFYENGQVINHAGSWRADDPGNGPGIIMPANPLPGQKFMMEDAPGIAEDQGTIRAAPPVTVPAGTFTQTIKVIEENPLDGDRGSKIFAAGVGMVKDGEIELVEYNF